MRAAVTNGPKPHCPALASKYPELREYPKYPKYHTGWSVRHSTRECCQAFRAESSPTKHRSRSSALGRGSSDPTGRAAARTVPRGPPASASAARTTHAMLVFRLSSLHPPVRDAADVEWRVGAQLRVFPIGVVLLQPQPVVRKHGRMLRARRRCLISASPPPAARAQQSTAV